MKSLNKYIHTLINKIQPFQPILIWLLAAYMAYQLGFHGFEKLKADGFWTGAFERWGYPVWFRIFIGILEMLGALLLLIPKIRHFGGLLLFVIMIGALITRLINGVSFTDVASITFNAVLFLYFTSLHHTKSDTSDIVTTD